MKSLRCVKGMHDVLPPEMPKWHFLENQFRTLVNRYGFEEIRTPIIEPLELFVRGIGDATDIVEKEMYAFEDKGNAQLALRPEGTASVVRSFLQHNFENLSPVSKLYYLGPMFRRERPAKGRYRQFYQAGVELMGVSEATADAEVISMAVQFVEELGIESVQVQINSLGDKEDRPRYREALVDFLSEKKEALCSDCSRRLETNPLRILDCKVPQCIDAVSGSPSVLEFLSEDSRHHFEELQKYLKLYGVSFTVNPQMVRGLDYYTRTIFEIQGAGDLLGAQSTIVGGGRYNGLVKQLGGRDTATIGFAFGIERLLLLLGDNARQETRKTVFVAGVGEGDAERAIIVGHMLRKAGLNVEVPYRQGSLRAQLKRADKSGASVAVIAGEEEYARNAVMLRNLQSGEQKEVGMEILPEKIRELL
jgi:histidyl-tRNA synthetase